MTTKKKKSSLLLTVSLFHTKYNIVYCDSGSDLRPKEDANQPAGGNINIEENGEEKEVSAPDDVQDDLESDGEAEAEADEAEEEDETSAGNENDAMTKVYLFLL